MTKYTYSLESYYHNKWVAIIKGETRDYCIGYFHARSLDSPRNAMRVIRSDGKITHECNESKEVFIGMVAGYPTPEQYEYAAKSALEKAEYLKKIK